MLLANGSRLGPYEIIAPLGAGGMGEVYRAHDARLGRDVAIKRLSSDLTSDAHARERLRREAMVAAALDHPYICKVFEIGEDGDALFIVMEYVVGETLHRREANGPIPLPDALRVALEIAEAVEAAHAAGILHRDLKPANIILTRQGHVKVLDFGLAKRVAGPASADAATCTLENEPLTARGTIVGTPDYMSPEQMKGLPLDARSDIFSFGVILGELIGGRHPFRKTTTVETMSAVLAEPPALSSDVPPNVAALLRRLLAKPIDERCASMSEARIELARLAASWDSVAAPSRASAATSARKWIGAAALAILGFAAAYVWTQRGPQQPAAPAQTANAAAIRSIAVLPLDNYSGDASQDYFAEGMTDELTADLATISQLRVISRGSVMQFKGARRPPTPELARLLNVDAIVEGSVRRSGNTVRVTAQLIDARADKHLWARTFERHSSDVLALQDDLASAIAREIHVQLTPTEQSRLAAAPRVNPEAYDTYLKGRYFFNRPSDDNLKKAITHFEQAVALSPEFAPAFSGLSDAYLWAGYNEGVLTATEARPKAKAAAETAVRLADTSAEAHTSLAVFKLFYEYDWAGSEREFRRAIALNPNYAFAHDQFGLGLAFQGRLDEAISEGRRAAELDPLSPQIPIDNALALMFQRNYQAAKDQARRAAELDPTYFFPQMFFGWVDLQDRKFADAIGPLKKAKTMDAPAFVTAWLAYAYAASGDRARAMSELEELKRVSLRGEILPFNLAVVHLGLGDRQRAIDYLERAYASDSQWMGWLKKDRMFDPLRSEPRFIALMKKLRLD
jgi:TolB-like protein/Flp pilus assembly protein TadD/predicted Ser/Thr protein kinase